MEIKYPNYRSGTLTDKSKKYELSALFDADSLFYGLFDLQHNMQSAGSMPKEALNRSPWQELDIKKAKIAYAHLPFIVVPSHEYSAAVGIELLRHITPVGDTDIVRNDYCPRYDVRIVYAVPPEELSLVNGSFEQVSAYHYITTLMDLGHDTTSSSSQPTVMATCLGKHLNIVVTQGDDLLLANRYYAPTEYQRLYYIGLVYQQLALDNSQCHLRISGLFSDDLINILKKHFSMIIHNPGIVADIDHAHQYSPLQFVSRCA